MRVLTVIDCGQGTARSRMPKVAAAARHGLRHQV